MTGRKSLGLGEPPTDVTTFPVKALTGDWFRAHSASNGPWWFSHDGSGRFDLSPPHGTCYLASHVGAAVHERLGETLVKAGMISGTEADQMKVSALPLTEAVADATVQRATRFGVTREIGTVVPYDLPQRWAARLHAAGHDGLRYWPRFSTSPAFRAVALFGPAGADATRPPDPAPLLGRAAARKAGITVIDLPRALPTMRPPM